jgi:hypothetical protein
VAEAEGRVIMTRGPIAVVQGAPGAVVDDLLSAFVARWSPRLRIAGVVADGDGVAQGKCSAGYLRSIASGKLFSIFAGDGGGLTGGNVAAAAELAAREIAEGCDLVVLNRFARLEAEGEGLCRGFTAALDAGLPLLSTLSPHRMAEFKRFAGSGFAVLPPEAAAIDAWAEALPSPVRAMD